MIKTTADGRFYVAADPSKTFATNGDAKQHEIELRRRNTLMRPDSRSAVQRMADDSFKPPMMEQPGRFDALKASLQKKDAGYKSSWSREQRLLHSIKLTEAREQDEVDAATARREWFEQPAVQAGLAEAKRLLSASEDDPSVDNADIVLATHVIESYQTVGADLTAVGSMLRKLRGFESDRITTAQIAANDKLNVALAQVQALSAAMRPSIKVPVTGETLGDRGSSLVTNLMAADANYEQIDAAFDALNKFHAGDASALEAVLSGNEATSTTVQA